VAQSLIPPGLREKLRRTMNSDVRATLRVTQTTPRLALVVQDAKRVPNQRLHNLWLLRTCR
jgi:hypothetical protein